MKGKSKWQPFAGIALACGLMLASNPTNAAMITYFTPPGSTVQGEPVDAEATFTTGTDSVDIELRNFLEDPNSVKQVITGIFFELSGGQTTGTLQSISSPNLERSVDGDGNYSDSGTFSSGWVLTDQSPFIAVDIINNPMQPRRGVIGPPDSGTDTFDNAEGSIRNNGSHNPFVNQVANFELEVTGVTPDSTVVSAVFQFNTTGEEMDRVVGMPEPGGLMLLLMGLLIAGARRLH